MWLLRVVIVSVYFVTGTVDVILFPQHVVACDCSVLWLFLCTLWPVIVMYCGCDFVSTTRCYLWLLRVVIVSVHVVTTKCDVLWMWFCFHNTLLLMAAMCYDSCGCFCTWCYQWFRCAVVSCWWHILLGAMCCVFVSKPGVTCECAVLCFRWKE